MSKKVTNDGSQSGTENKDDQHQDDESTGQGDEGTNKEEESSEDSQDESKWDDKTKSYIKKLRKENQKLRTKTSRLEEEFSSFKGKLKNLGGSSEDGESEESPEEMLARADAVGNQLAFDNGVLASAIEHGISGKDTLEYFRFLVTKKVESLKDDEELDAEDLAELAKKAKQVTNPGGKSGRTSVDESQEDRNKRKPGNSDEVTLDQFVKMSVAEKSALYAKSQDTYNKLFAEAKSARRI